MLSLAIVIGGEVIGSSAHSAKNNDVIPAKAGIQIDVSVPYRSLKSKMDSRFRGNDDK
jgi:hypothetical protein